MSAPLFRELHVYLERNLPPNRAAYASAQARQPALQPYATILQAAQAAADATRDEGERDGIVGAIVAEHQAAPAALWSAAAVVAMAPALGSILKEIRTRGGRKDAPYSLLDAFYESVQGIALGPRIAFRLYSETRRQAFRAARLRPGDAASASSVALVALGYGVDPELWVDATRFFERARTTPPRPEETPFDYLERIWPSRTLEQRLERQERLQSFRTTTLAALGRALRAFSPTNPTETAQ